MGATYRTDPQAAVFELTVTGKVTREDFDALAGPLEAFIARHGTIKLLEIVRDYGGFETGMLWDGVKLDLRVLPHISHCAVVSDLNWISPLAKAAGALLTTRLRCFSLNELDQARAWLSDPDAEVVPKG